MVVVNGEGQSIADVRNDFDAHQVPFIRSVSGLGLLRFSCAHSCMRECVNALMKIKRWIWGTVSELGLNAGRIWASPPQISEGTKDTDGADYRVFYRMFLQS